MNKICSIYISEVRALFPIYGKNEKKYLENLKITIIDYCEEENVDSINNLYDNFGSPHEVVNNYFDTVDTDIIIKKIKKTKYLKILLTAIVLCLFICTVSYCLLIINEYHMIKDQQIIYINDVVE